MSGILLAAIAGLAVGLAWWFDHAATRRINGACEPTPIVAVRCRCDWQSEPVETIAAATVENDLHMLFTHELADH